MCPLKIFLARNVPMCHSFLWLSILIKSYVYNYQDCKHSTYYITFTVLPALAGGGIQRFHDVYY